MRANAAAGWGLFGMRNGHRKIWLAIHAGGFLLLGALSLTGRAAPPVKPARPAPPAKLSAIEFNRDIRPLLSENCFICHGPDANKRMAGLRLDVRENAIANAAPVGA
jgi:mono/diheme cytochrome c family protein